MSSSLFQKKRRQYLNKIKSKGKIEDWIQKGMGEAEITNVKRVDRALITGTYKRALSNIINPKYERLIDVLVMDENIQKIKNKIEILFEINGEENKQLRFGIVGKTLDEIRQPISRIASHNEIKGVDINFLKDAGFRIDGSTNINLQKYDGDIIKKVISTKLKMIIRKGR